MKLVLYISVLYLTIVFFPIQVSSQNKIDSLLKVLVNKKDTVRANTLNELSKEFLSKDFEKSLKYANEALFISKNFKFKEGEANALQNIGSYYKKKSNNDKAIEYYTKSLNIRIEINDTLGIPRSYNAIGDIYLNRDEYKKAYESYNKAREKYAEAILLFKKQNSQKVKSAKKSLAITLYKIGNVYNNTEDYENAIIYYLQTLKFFEEQNEKRGIASCENNIGQVYMNMAKLDDTLKLLKSLEYFKKALEINEELKNKVEIAISNDNIGLTYIQIAEIFFKKRENSKESKHTNKLKYFDHKITQCCEKAIEYYNISLKIREEIGDEKGQASNLNNIGTAYFFLRNYNKSIEYYFNSLKINEKFNIKKEIAINSYYLGQSYIYLKQYNIAINFFNKSLIVANELDNRRTKYEVYRSLSAIYDSLSNYTKAYEYFKAYSELKDTVFKESSDKIIQELNTKYETDKKEQQNKLLSKDILFKQNQIKQQRILIIVFILIFIVIIVFSVLLYQQYNAKKKANQELIIKNNLITLQKQEITDSIHYAKRIQQAVLPHGDFIEKFVSEYFIMFKPKDIVSGDFYWLKKFEHSNLCVIAAADCTGHGVPGAFMSLLGSTFLNEIVNEYSNTPEKIIKASDILFDLRNYVIKSLHQKGVIGEQKDGMDLALCVIDPNNKIVQYAGANNPLYIIREKNLIEIKADKMPIGIHDRANEPFTNHVFNYKENDQFYIFSDGFSDQFGGIEGKKYLSKNFKKFLLSINDNSMIEQRSLIEKESVEWRNELEQIDDQLVVGFKV